MKPNYLLCFKCAGRDPFTLTCESAEQVPDLIREYCVETGDSCMLECPTDAKPAIAIHTRTADGKFIVEVSIEPDIVEKMRNQFKQEGF